MSFKWILINFNDQDITGTNDDKVMKDFIDTGNGPAYCTDDGELFDGLWSLIVDHSTLDDIDTEEDESE
jgi:hypothetical protein